MILAPFLTDPPGSVDKGDDDDGSEDGFLKKRTRSKDEEESESVEYRKWLAGEGGRVQQELQPSLEPLQRYWSDPSLSADDRFLRDYITKQMWRDDRPEAMPVYTEVVQAELSEDDKILDETDNFERKLNFRFEEEGASEVIP